MERGWGLGRPPDCLRCGFCLFGWCFRVDWLLVGRCLLLAMFVAVAFPEVVSYGEE